MAGTLVRCMPWLTSGTYCCSVARAFLVGLFCSRRSAAVLYFKISSGNNAGQIVNNVGAGAGLMAGAVCGYPAEFAVTLRECV